MIDAKTINTRIVLRNDELSAWEKSEKQLLKGEVAFARLSGTNDFEMRVGTGDKTWNQLSNSNVITAVKDGSLTWSKMSSDVTDWKSAVEGNIEKLDNDLSALSDKVEGLSSELKGDIAAAKSEAITSAKAYTDEQTAASTGSLYNLLTGEMIGLIGSSNQDNKDYTDGKIAALSTDLTSTYATKDELSEAKSEAILSAENYTDLKIAALDFTDTLANLSDEIVKVADESAKAYTDAEVEALSNSLSGTVDSKVTDLYGVIDGHVSTLNLHIEATRDQLEGNIATAKSEAITSAETYTDEKIAALNIDLTSTYATKDELSEAESEAILSARNYTDSEIEALSNSISGTVDSQVTDLYTKIDENYNELYQHIGVTFNDLDSNHRDLIDTAKSEAIADANAYTDGKIGSLGDVFNFKGIKNSVEELQAITDAKTGDVYLVGTKEFVYTAEKSWVEFGDGSDHATKTELEKEAQDRKAADNYLSSAIDNKIFYGNYGNVLSAESLSVVKISQADYHTLVEEDKVNDKVVYIVNNVGAYNMYGETISELSTTGIEGTSEAANTLYVDKKVQEVKDEIPLSVSQLIWDIATINCGGADL